MSIKIKDFQKMLMSGDIPTAFTKLIKDADIYGEKPQGSLKEFQRAFKSKKTLPEVRYIMAASALLGDPGLLERSLRSSKLKQRHKFSAAYTRKGGKLKLSHFKVRALNITGKTTDFPLAKKAKQMMMGTPVDAKGIQLVHAALRREPRTEGEKREMRKLYGQERNAMKVLNPEKYFIKYMLPKLKREAHGRAEKIEAKAAELRAEIEEKSSYLQKLARAKIKAESTYQQALERYEQDRVAGDKMISGPRGAPFLRLSKGGGFNNFFGGYAVKFDELKGNEKLLPVILRSLKKIPQFTQITPDEIRIFDPELGGLNNKYIREGDTIYTMVPQRVYQKDKNGNLIKDAHGHPISRVRGKKEIKIRPLNDNEKARILTTLFELSKHYMQLIGVVSSTIKLSDKRRRFGYIDDTFVYKFDDPVEDTGEVRLHGFPEHLAHYIKEAIKFSKWIEGLEMTYIEQKLLDAMQAALNFATSIDGKGFDTPEEAQDLVEELFPLLFPILHFARHQHLTIIQGTKFFDKTVSEHNPVPKVEHHVRHKTKKPGDFHTDKQRFTVQQRIDAYVQRIAGERPPGVKLEGLPNDIVEVPGKDAKRAYEIEKPKPKPRGRPKNPPKKGRKPKPKPLGRPKKVIRGRKPTPRPVGRPKKPIKNVEKRPVGRPKGSTKKRKRRSTKASSSTRATSEST